jgi:hypothetical protein
MKKSSLLYTIVVLFVLLLMVGCAPQVDVAATDAAVAAGAAAKETSEAMTVATEQKVQEEAEAHAAQLTADAQATLEAEAIAAATSTAIAEATAAFQATGTQSALDRSATATARVYERATQTAEAIVQATADAQPMADLVAKLNADGYLKSTEGEWQRLDFTFDQAWAQIGWYWWWPTGITMENFVLRTDASWDSASDTPNDSGCGFVIRPDSKGNHYMTFLSMNGWSVVGEMKNEYWRYIQKKPVSGLAFPQGSAEIVLVVEDETITMLVNGEKVMRDVSLVAREGELALTILSGTNKGFGTSCTMENIDLWILK